MLTDSFAPALAVAVDADILFRIPRGKWSRFKSAFKKEPLTMIQLGSSVCAAIARSHHLFILVRTKKECAAVEEACDRWGFMYRPQVVKTFAELRDFANQSLVAVCYSNLFAEEYTLGAVQVHRYRDIGELVKLVGDEVVYSFGGGNEG